MIDFDWNHLKKVKANYFQHAWYAMYFNFLALLVFITGFIHAIFPFVFAFTPYKISKKIVAETEKHFKK